ncbi:MAG: 50S ribosomal protein L30 [Anaerolineaceae bacterium]|nr:50S ribosomal protein L30 [Anaerolineaceae bacterium]NTV35330.1 50S ribosomal protein L30 [Anaerolineaceae bacterium]
MPKKAAAQPKPVEKYLRITWVKSTIGYDVKHKATVRALGLRHLHQTVVQKDTPVLRGMLYKVNNLVVIEEQVEQ